MIRLEPPGASPIFGLTTAERGPIRSPQADPRGSVDRVDDPAVPGALEPVGRNRASTAESMSHRASPGPASGAWPSARLVRRVTVACGGAAPIASVTFAAGEWISCWIIPPRVARAKYAK